jgi:hypothetical protein
MPLVYRHESHPIGVDGDERETFIIRVDGDVLETFVWGESEQRVLLAWLSVQVYSRGRGHLALQIGSAPPNMDMPLYEVLQKPKAVKGRNATVVVNMSPEEEPVLREFFTQVAQLCGRPMVT